MQQSLGTDSTLTTTGAYDQVQALSPAHRQHLLDEGFTESEIDQGVAEGVWRTADSAGALELGVVAAVAGTKGLTPLPGLAFILGGSRRDDTPARVTVPYVQCRVDQRPMLRSRRQAGKYMPSLRVRPRPGVLNGVQPDQVVAITEGMKEAAAAWYRCGIAIAALPAPSFFRGALKGRWELPGVPYVGDSDAPFIPEVIRTMVTMAVEQGRRLAAVPLAAGDKAGFVEWILQKGATADDVRNLIASAQPVDRWLFGLLDVWTDATDDQWRAAHPRKQLGKSSLRALKVDVAKTVAECLARAGVQPAQAEAFLLDASKWCGCTKAVLMQAYKARREAIREKARKLLQQRKLESGEFVYEVDETTTLEAMVERNLRVAQPGELVASQMQFWRWDADRGYWMRRDGLEVESWISHELPRYFIPGEDGERHIFGTAQRRKAVIDWLRVHLDDPRINARTDLLPFRNGVVDIPADELLPHAPELGCTYQLQGDCIEGMEDVVALAGEAPAFVHLLDTSYAREHWDLVRAAIRLVIDPTMPSGHCVVLIGDSGSGKGAFVRLLQRMFPPEAVSSLTRLSEVNRPEAVYQSVVGRRLVCWSDLQGAQAGLGGFFELCDRGSLTARRLYSSETIPVRFEGRCLIATTKVPTFTDGDGQSGWSRRAFVVPTIHGERDRAAYDGDLEADMGNEIGAIACWAMEMDRDYAIQVVQNRTDNDELLAVRAEAQAEADSVGDFANKLLVPVTWPDPYFPDYVDLLDAYTLFCHATRRKPLSEPKFKGQLRKLLPHLNRDRQRRRIGGRLKQYPAFFFGFALNKTIWVRKQSETGVEPVQVESQYEPGKMLVNNEATLRALADAGWKFQWDRDLQQAETGYLNRRRLDAGESLLMRLKEHRILPPTIADSDFT